MIMRLRTAYPFLHPLFTGRGTGWDTGGTLKRGSPSNLDAEGPRLREQGNDKLAKELEIFRSPSRRQTPEVTAPRETSDARIVMSMTPSRFWSLLAGALMLLPLLGWMFRNGPSSGPPRDVGSSPVAESTAPSVPGPQPNAPGSSQEKTPEPARARVVLVVGRLVEPGGFPPIPALLHATQIVPAGDPKPVIPADDGGFSFYWTRPETPVSFEVRSAFMAVLGSRTVVQEAAKRRVDLPAAAPGATLDAGAVPLPASDKLSWVEGAVHSSTGAPIDGLRVELVGQEEFDGLRLSAVDRAATLGHAPNVPAKYAADARFLLRHVRPGRYELSVGARGHRLRRLPLEFPALAGLPPLTLTLDTCTRAASGRVVDAATGTPLAGASLLLSDGKRTIGSATTDAFGVFKAWIQEDPAGPELRLAVSLDGYAKAVEIIPESRVALHREIALRRER
jgi:hypothetical protein